VVGDGAARGRPAAPEAIFDRRAGTGTVPDVTGAACILHTRSGARRTAVDDHGRGAGAAAARSSCGEKIVKRLREPRAGEGVRSVQCGQADPTPARTTV
jgi:hypothetical protein